MMVAADRELKWCWKCYCKVWFHHGVCEWSDTHYPPDPQWPADDADDERSAEAAQRKRDAAEGFDQ